VQSPDDRLRAAHVSDGSGESPPAGFRVKVASLGRQSVDKSMVAEPFLEQENGPGPVETSRSTG